MWEERSLRERVMSAIISRCVLFIVILNILPVILKILCGIPEISPLGVGSNKGDFHIFFMIKNTT